MARRLLPRDGMRIIVGLVIIACVVGFAVSHRAVKEPAKQPQPPVTTSAQDAAPRQPSEHNWAKRSIDRAAEVKRQVANQRAQDETK